MKKKSLPKKANLKALEKKLAAIIKKAGIKEFVIGLTDGKAAALHIECSSDFLKFVAVKIIKQQVGNL